MKAGRAKTGTTGTASDLRAPNGVHWIQARHAMEDRESWRVATLVAIGDGSIDVAFDGEEAIVRFTCGQAELLRTALSEGTPLGERQPGVIIVQKWSMMIVPLGKDGKPPPARLRFLTGAVSMEEGKVTKALALDSSYELQLFSIRRE